MSLKKRSNQIKTAQSENKFAPPFPATNRRKNSVHQTHLPAVVDVLVDALDLVSRLVLVALDQEVDVVLQVGGRILNFKLILLL